MTARGQRQRVHLAWLIGFGSLLLVVASVILLALDGRAIDSLATAQFQYFLQAPIVGILGVLIATRRPGNRIGWLLLAIAVTDAIYLAADFAAMRGLLAGASPRGWVAWPAWLVSVTGTLDPILLAPVTLFFPDGRLLAGKRWRWATLVVVAAGGAMVAASLIATTPVQLSPRLPSVPNPLAVPALDALTNSGGSAYWWPLLLVGALLIVVTARYRRSRGVERTQMRWFAYVAAAGLALLVLASVGAGGDLTSTLGFFGVDVLIPLAIGLAVIRYGLYDIDVFISRTIVYGSLAVFITAVYVAIAVGIGTLIGSGGKPNLALSILATAIVAVGFQPLRERVQKVANRLVYGKRANPYEVLSQFSGRVAEGYASDEVLPRMARVLADGTGADAAEVWLRTGTVLRRAARYPVDDKPRASVDVNSASGLSIPTADRTTEVRHQGELLGALTVTKRRGEAMSPIEIKLMDDLAHQAGLVLKNVGLTADLRARLDDLRTSRQRLVAAQDDERRRLERNLHDGAQQYLVAIKVKLGLVEMLTTRDPAKAVATLIDLKRDADEALETLRDLARGIYPPLLADQGLTAALRSQAHKATVPVRVDADGIGRYPQETEAALYFCTLEALQNVQKYAAASAVHVRLRADDDQVLVEIIDDGRGFDPSTVMRGAGLTNMEDRINALGGGLHIESTPGIGTTLRATVPVAARSST